MLRGTQTAPLGVDLGYAETAITDVDVINAAKAGGEQTWWFLSNHGFVLLAVARDPRQRIADYARAVGITDRACQRILNDLTDAGYLLRHRVGRRNHYDVNSDKVMRHPLVRTQQVGDLLDALLSDRQPEQP